MASYNYPPYNPYSQMQPYPNQMMMQPPPQMNQMQPIQMQNPAPVQQTAQGLSGASRPVTNREEAMGVPADFSGALMVFPDLSNNRVYVKRWNMQTGSADFGEFAPVIQSNTQQTVEQPPVAFASLQDFQSLQDTVSKLQSEIERLKKPAGKAVKKNEPDE